MSNKYDLLMIENLQLQIQIGKDDTMESKNSMAELVIEFNKLEKLRDADVIREVKQYGDADAEYNKSLATNKANSQFLNDLFESIQHNKKSPSTKKNNENTNYIEMVRKLKEKASKVQTGGESHEDRKKRINEIALREGIKAKKVIIPKKIV